jgi:hypothetical protein
VVAVIALVFGGGWTAYTYFSAKTDGARMASLEARKPFETERLTLYLKATDTVSTIVNSKDAKEIAQAKREFLKLHHGSLVSRF